MTFAALAHLVRQNVRRTRRSFALAVFGISVGVASLSFFLALSAGVRAGVLSRVFPSGRVEVVPPSSSLDSGPLSILGIGGPPRLDERKAAALAQRPEVEAAWARQRLAFPARAQGGAAIIGRDVRAELVAEGMDPAAMAGESLGPIPFSDDPGSQRACASDADCSAPEYCPADTLKCERPVPG
jgi:hypothetical protein